MSKSQLDTGSTAIQGSREQYLVAADIETLRRSRMACPSVLGPLTASGSRNSNQKKQKKQVLNLHVEQLRLLHAKHVIDRTGIRGLADGCHFRNERLDGEHTVIHVRVMNSQG